VSETHTDEPAGIARVQERDGDSNVVVTASATQRDAAASSARVFTARGVVLEALERVSREIGTATGVITHNAVIAAMAVRVVRLADGRVVSVDTHERKAGARELQW
jgi:hypothetical protein